MQEITIHGKRIRTNNNQLQDVMQLWNEILPMNLQGDLYAVYYNFASNYLGDYDLIIGAKEAPLSDQVTLFSGDYIEIPVENNDIVNMGKAWETIWANAQIEAKRAYKTDYEKYNKDGTISIFLSIK